MTFTVEAVTTPVAGGDWDVLYNVLDDVPGSMLVEDPDFPRLIIPTDCETPMKAAAFVSGISTVLGFEIVEAKVYETPEDDSALAPSEGVDMPDPEAITRVREWLTSIPSIEGKASNLALR